jgi:hypothetical protein
LLVLGTLAFASAGLLAVLLMNSGPLPRAAGGPDAIPVRQPEPMDARLAVLNAFERHPLVALSEAHGLKEEADFINSLIRHPDFPRKVNAIVLEAGNAKHQKLIDGYVNGEAVSLNDLRRVWRDHTCAALGPRDSSNVEGFFATVREVNRRLPPAGRIRVLAGDPPIDWAAVKTMADVSPWLARRETHYARVVEAEVLARNLKALLIVGGDHLDRGPPPHGDPDAGLMMQIVEHKHAGKTFIVVPHEGFGEHNAVWEAKLSAWPRPSVALVADTWLALPKDAGREDVPRQRAWEGPPSPPWPQADAILYLGPRDELSMEQLPADVYRDEAYVQELDRRSRICRGRPLDRAALTRPRPRKWAEMFPAGDVFIGPSECSVAVVVLVARDPTPLPRPGM